MLRFEPLVEQQAPGAQVAELLQRFRDVLGREGMASMDEYGDMLKWALPSQGDGWCRYFHVFDPGFCSFSDAFRGTVHYHGGEIRGTVLLGEMQHDIYEAVPDANGDRFLGDQPYSLTRHSRIQPEGTAYRLPAMVPHWVRPRALTLTYFEEQDNDVMGDLLNPASDETDEHVWEQPDADALVPRLSALIDERLAALTVPA